LPPVCNIGSTCDSMFVLERHAPPSHTYWSGVEYDTLSISSMFDHIGIFVTDTDRSFRFFEKALAPLGISIRERQPHWGSMVMGGTDWHPFLWIGPAGKPYYGTPVRVTESRPLHLAFRARS